jgi:uncharacterized repeat protein (TIGR04076 family)
LGGRQNPNTRDALVLASGRSALRPYSLHLEVGQKKKIMKPDEFELYDLEVVVEAIEGHCTCAMHVGDRVLVRGGKLALPPGQEFCLYALQAVIPLLPAKQRQNHPADWMETDARATCPDPACRLIMRIDRVARRVLRHDDVSPIPWDPTEPS